MICAVYCVGAVEENTARKYFAKLKTIVLKDKECSKVVRKTEGENTVKNVPFDRNRKQSVSKLIADFSQSLMCPYQLPEGGLFHIYQSRLQWCWTHQLGVASIGVEMLFSEVSTASNLALMTSEDMSEDD
ncbi:hypothetical protein TNCV_3002261 [Trichonephila clavipes]|nr:hypothetical protein TNCV_3002261 [Trichonephila clavipes]